MAPIGIEVGRGNCHQVVPKLQTAQGEIWVVQANIQNFWLVDHVESLGLFLLFCIHTPTFYAIMLLGLDTLSCGRVLSISPLSCWQDCKVPQDRALFPVFIEHLLDFSGTDCDDADETSAAGALSCMKPW